MYIMLIIVVAAQTITSNGPNVATSTQEYESLSSCIAAGQNINAAWKEQQKNMPNLFIRCTKK